MTTHDTPPAPPRPAHPWVDRYLEHLVVAKGLSEHSIAAYSTDIAGFLTFLIDHDGRLEATSDETVLLYLMHLRSRGLASRSLARHLSALRGFFAFAADEAWLQHHDQA